MRVAVIDGDTLIWIAAYNIKDTGSIEQACISIDNMVTEILINTKAEKYCGFLQGKEKSHRDRMFPDYKANRPSKPEWYTQYKDAIQGYLTNVWKFILVQGMESDDAVAVVNKQLTKAGLNPVICSSDKDMKQLVGEHYNTKSKITSFIDQETAIKNMMIQILMGDAADNIKGIPGVGIKTATNIVEGAEDGWEQIINDTIAQYVKYYGSVRAGLSYFCENAMKVILLDDLNFKYELTDVPLSIKQKEEENSNETGFLEGTGTLF